MTYSAISSPNGTRDLIFDATLVLETGETLDTVAVTTAAPYLSISNVGKNASETTVDGKTVAADKGVTFTVSTTAQASAKAIINVAFVGTAGTADNYNVTLPVQASLVVG